MSQGNRSGQFRHEALAVVFRVTDAQLTVLAWRRGREPFAGRWAIPSGPVDDSETLGASVARHLSTKVDLTWIAHLEQLETRSDPARDPFQRTIATAYLGLIPSSSDPVLPEHTAWIDVNELAAMAFDHASVIASAIQRLRARLSYSNIGFALAPAEFTLAQLRGLYVAALGHDVSATNLQRVLQRRDQLQATGATARPTASGGRPAALYRFTHHELAITDPFFAFRPM